MNLKPCPECNSIELSVEKTGFNAFIKCDKCGYTRGGFSDKDILISVWNKESIK